jgi:hypothetical protein
MATSPLFGWEEPDDVDLVKDGAAAIRTLGNAIDTSMGDLLGGTSGQVLSKNSNTNMDFTWVTPDDANAIQNAIVDAKGDLIAASAADTPARLAVGNNGETLVADSSTSTGLRYTANFAAGKNKIINGDFRINQRSFTSNTTTGTFNFDRFKQVNSGGTTTVTPQTFTAGTAPVSGYEAINFLQIVTASQSGVNDYAGFNQPIEDVRAFAGQTVTMSFWAKASTGTPTIGVSMYQDFGTGGSSGVATSPATQTITTSWARYSFTVAVPSISGKTIGTGSNLAPHIFTSVGTGISASGFPAVGIQNITAQFWGIQVEAGSVATAFQTATGTIQGELAACQRYYWRNTTGQTGGAIGWGINSSTTAGQVYQKNPVTMRTVPTSIDYASVRLTDLTSISAAITNLVITASESSPEITKVVATVASGLTQYRPTFLTADSSAAGYVGFSAEL